MATPLLVCVFIGRWMDKKFNTKWILLFVLLGIVSGVWSTIKMFQKILAKDAQRMEEEKKLESNSVQIHVSVPKLKSRVYQDVSRENNGDD